MTLARIRSGLVYAGGALLLAALLFRALIPAGFMATFDRTGAIEIVMCSASAGHETVVFKVPGDDASKPAPADESCAFAMVATAPPQEAPGLEAARVIYAYEYAFAALQPQPLVAAYAPQAPPTGPPLFI
jgi:hypothetical protein